MLLVALYFKCPSIPRYLPLFILYATLAYFLRRSAPLRYISTAFLRLDVRNWPGSKVNPTSGTQLVAFANFEDECSCVCRARSLSIAHVPSASLPILEARCTRNALRGLINVKLTLQSRTTSTYTQMRLTPLCSAFVPFCTRQQLFRGLQKCSYVQMIQYSTTYKLRYHGDFKISKLEYFFPDDTLNRKCLTKAIVSTQV